MRASAGISRFAIGATGMVRTVAALMLAASAIACGGPAFTPDTSDAATTLTINSSSKTTTGGPRMTLSYSLRVMSATTGVTLTRASVYGIGMATTNATVDAVRIEPQTSYGGTIVVNAAPDCTPNLTIYFIDDKGKEGAVSTESRALTCLTMTVQGPSLQIEF